MFLISANKLLEALRPHTETTGKQIVQETIDLKMYAMSVRMAVIYVKKLR